MHHNPYPAHQHHRDCLYRVAGGGSNEDDVTIKLQEIVHINSALRLALEKGASAKMVQEDWDFLQVRDEIHHIKLFRRLSGRLTMDLLCVWARLRQCAGGIISDVRRHLQSPAGGRTHRCIESIVLTIKSYLVLHVAVRTRLCCRCLLRPSSTASCPACRLR